MLLNNLTWGELLQMTMACPGREAGGGEAKPGFESNSVQKKKGRLL